MAGKEILRSIFAEQEGQLIDWRTTQRVYDSHLAKEAFGKMTDARLDRAEDSYEVFVLSSLAETASGAEDLRGYIYHYGCGVTGTSEISAERFGTFSEQFSACINAARRFVQNDFSPVGEECFEGMCHKLYELLANDLFVRVPREQEVMGAALMSESLGASVTARELWRLVRDSAYDLLSSDKISHADDHLLSLVTLAKSLVVPSDRSEEYRRYERMRQVAECHLRDLSSREPIRIFVTSHKRVELSDALSLQPVQVGPGNRDNRFSDYLHDDEGENISDKNPMYCELTTQYWAWKNVSAKYVGFCHYRRYFNFSERTYRENPYGEVMDDYIDEDAIARYGLDDESIRRCVEGYDVITTGFHDIRDFPGAATTPRMQYKDASRLHYEDLALVAQIVKELHPDYAADVDAFLDGHESCFCNMYIMRRELFSAYCEWLFPILEEFERRCDMSRYSKEALRTPGHLAERLFNIYYIHAMRSGAGWKTKQLQCVHFERPDVVYPLSSIADAVPDALADRSVVPVVFASDNAYVPMLTTTIFSMLENASSEHFYDIVVLERNISPQKRQQMERFFSRYENASVRFYNVANMIKGYDLATNNEHISMETYYRFLVQEILSEYDKVLYLDSDLIICGDIARLFDVELGDNLLAAAHDIDYLGNLNMPDGKRMKYTRNVLKLEDPYAYFQAGVLVLNTAELRRLHSVPDWMKIVGDADFIYDDQDILNAECQGRVCYLPFDWNVMHDCTQRVSHVFSWAPNDVFDAYNASRSNPNIIHYAGSEKPWVNPSCDYAVTYWDYARRTPFYEELVARLASSVAGRGLPRSLMPLHEKAISEDNPLRRFIDPIAPYGTARREVMKSIVRKLRSRR